MELTRIVRLAALIFPIILVGQQLQLGTGRALAAVGLRPRPDKSSPAIFQISIGAPLRVLDATPKNGFVRILPEHGPAGWIAAESLESIGTPSLVACAQSDDAKKRAAGGSGTVSILDFNDILKLQARAERLVGMGHELNREERAKLGSFQTVRISGYLAAKSDLPRTAGDCVGGLADDWLLNVTPDSNSRDFQGILARVSAWKRNPKWTLEKLQLIREKQSHVLVMGTLFYDGDSLVNDDSGNPISGVLHRAWLWELRQVTSLLVCTGADCEVGSPRGWVSLETFASN